MAGLRVECEVDRYIFCSRTGDMIKHCFFISDSNTFVGERAVGETGTMPADVAVIVPHGIGEGIMGGGREHSIHYLYGKRVGSVSSGESERYLIGRSLKWGRTATGVPVFDMNERFEEVRACILEGRECIASFITISDVGNGLSGHMRRMMEMVRTPIVCFASTNGSRRVATYRMRDGEVYEDAAVVILPN